MNLASVRTQKSSVASALFAKPKINSRHMLTGMELGTTTLKALLQHASLLKAERSKRILRQSLRGQAMALLFDKPSLRTKFSFTVAMQELGGMVIESHNSQRKNETPEDTARVLAGYCHVIVNRTYSQDILTRMASASPVPVINALSDTHHPCQTFGDLMTLRERFGNLKGLEVAYIGDGNNILNSMLLIMPSQGVTVKYACPEGYEPDAELLHVATMRARTGGGKIVACAGPEAAAAGAMALYTDVWTSMGFEDSDAERLKAFTGYQINESLYELADPRAAIMHCMPMIRGQEITDAMADHKNALLFQQSENRLHVQKALLEMMLC